MLKSPHKKRYKFMLLTSQESSHIAITTLCTYNTQISYMQTLRTPDLLELIPTFNGHCLEIRHTRHVNLWENKYLLFRENFRAGRWGGEGISDRRTLPGW